MDQLFRIVLDVKDADKASREIKKLKDAYKEVGTSAREIGTATVGGADPFAAATQAPPPVPGATIPGMPTQAPAAQGIAVRSGGTAFPGMIGSAGGVAMAAGRGDMFSAGAGMASTAGGILSRIGGVAMKAAPWALGGAAVLGLAGKLVGSEKERIRTIYGGGVSQRLGMGYEPAREWGLEMAREGIYAPTVKSYMAGLGAAGGSDLNKTNLERAQTYGIEGGTTGGFQATLQRAGFTGEINKSVYQVLEKAFGAGRIGTLFQSMGSIIEDSLSKGATKATETLKGGATDLANTLAAYSQYGKVSMEGAIATYEKQLQMGRGAANLQTPFDTMSFLDMHKKGDSIFETMLKMYQDPTAVAEAEYERFETMYGGDKDKIKQMYVLKGFTPQEAETIVSSKGKIPDKKEFVTHRPEDEVARESLIVQQMELLAGASKAFEDIKNEIILFFKGVGEKGETNWERDYRLYLEKDAEIQKNSDILLEAIKSGILTGNDISGKNEDQILKLISEIMEEKQNKVPISKEAMELFRGAR